MITVFFSSRESFGETVDIKSFAINWCPQHWHIFRYASLFCSSLCVGNFHVGHVVPSLLRPAEVRLMSEQTRAVESVLARYNAMKQQHLQDMISNRRVSTWSKLLLLFVLAFIFCLVLGWFIRSGCRVLCTFVNRDFFSSPLYIELQLGLRKRRIMAVRGDQIRYRRRVCPSFKIRRGTSRTDDPRNLLSIHSSLPSPKRLPSQSNISPFFLTYPFPSFLFSLSLDRFTPDPNRQGPQEPHRKRARLLLPRVQAAGPSTRPRRTAKSHCGVHWVRLQARPRFQLTPAAQ